MDDSGIVTLDLGSYQSDLMAINIDSSVGTSTSDTFIEYTLVQDVFGNTVTNVVVLQASSVIADTNNVKVNTFLFDATNAPTYNIRIYYNKAVDTTTFVCSEYSLMLGNDTSTDIVSLANGDCTKNTVYTYSLSVDFDITGTTATSIAALSSDPAWMNIDEQDDGGGITDVAGNTLGANVYNVQEGARVTRWFLDMENSELTLIFASSMYASAQ